MDPTARRIAITPGEPAGVGPELVVKIAQTSWPFELVVIADPDLLQYYAKLCGLPLTCHLFEKNNSRLNPASHITILPVSLKVPAEAGKPNSHNAAYVLETLKIAAQGCLDHTFNAVVTGPVHKGVINAAGIPFSGHTEFFAHISNTPHVVMMLATEKLRVALATTHLPLRDVPDAITPALLTQTLTVLRDHLMRYYNIAEPHILVAGLNPHAGEEGYLGREEIDVITPTLETLRARGFHLTGPLAADTLFTPERLHGADAVLAMYHDQGLPVLKYQGFGNAVNITLGLPFIRTSVDHGTAFSLAGTGLAKDTSLRQALLEAWKMVSLNRGYT